MKQDTVWVLLGNPHHDLLGVFSEAQKGKDECGQNIFWEWHVGLAMWIGKREEFGPIVFHLSEEGVR